MKKTFVLPKNVFSQLLMKLLNAMAEDAASNSEVNFF